MFQRSIDEIKKALDTQPIVAIDYALDAFSHSIKEIEQKDIIDSEIFILFCQAIFHSQEIKYENDSNLLDRLFEKNLTPNQKRFIGICLLRLLNNCVELLNSRKKHKIIELFDEVFERDLYNQLDIKSRSQTFEKENALKDVVLNLEKEFENLINSFNDINSINSFRTEFQRKLNSNPSKAIIHHFLPKELVKTVKLAEIFNLIEKYLEEKGGKKCQFFAETKKVMNNYLTSAQRFGSKYSCNYLGGFVTKILELLDKDFQNNPLSKPAELNVDKSEKKYPFLI